MQRLADLFLAARWYVALLIAAVTAAALVGLTRIDFEDEPRTIFEQQDSDFADLEQSFADFGADDNDILLVADGTDLFSADSLSRLRRLATETARIAGVESVASVFDLRRRGSLVVPLIPFDDPTGERFAAAKQAALEHPLAVGQLLSRDGRTMLLVARMAGGSLVVSEVQTMVSRVRDTVRRVHRRFGPAASDWPAIRSSAWTASRGCAANWSVPRCWARPCPSSSRSSCFAVWPPS